MWCTPDRGQVNAFEDPRFQTTATIMTTQTMQQPPTEAPMTIPIAAELSSSDPDETDDLSELSGTAYVKLSTEEKSENLG
mmetsp:Transcript_63519/g.168304  ORF Transcript_63519/g.168304 Transcript_63519/m.168304 type:complete len:80 (-) Transcript_63519:681-920(-)